eukprot:gene17783-23389_t
MYVLARDCTDQYFAAEGICCKLDQAIHFLVYYKPELFAHTKYLLQSDDDTFWRVDQALRWLSAVDKAGYDNIPVIANGVPSISDSTYGVYRVEDGCKEIFTNGWYQPFMMNHAGILRIANSTRQLGITQTCKAFKCSQDLGLGLLMNPEHIGVTILQPDSLVIHAVRHLQWDDCEAEYWPKHLKYNQHMIVGCGTIDRINGSDVGVLTNDDDEPMNEWIPSSNSNLNGQLVPRIRFLEVFTVNDCPVPGKLKD